MDLVSEFGGSFERESIGVVVPQRSKRFTSRTGGVTVRAVLVPVVTLIRRRSPILAGVDVAGAPRREEHLNPHDDQDRCHGDQARHGRIPFVPKSRKTWIRERDESGGQEVDKGRCDEDTCAEVPREEEEAVRDWDRQVRQALDDYGE